MCIGIVLRAPANNNVTELSPIYHMRKHTRHANPRPSQDAIGEIKTRNASQRKGVSNHTWKRSRINAHLFTSQKAENDMKLLKAELAKAYEDTHLARQVQLPEHHSR